MKNMKLTEGPIVKNMLLFALPMMLGNFLQQIYNIADMFIVGRFIGSDALAGSWIGIHIDDIFNIADYRAVYGEWSIILWE